MSGHTTLGTSALAGLTPAERHAYLTAPVILPGLRRASKPKGKARRGELGGLVRVLNAVFDPRQCRTSKERLLAIAIGREMGRGYEADPSWQTLSAKTGLSRSAVFRLLDKLCDDDRPLALFTREQRGRGQTSMYRLRMSPASGTRQVPLSGLVSPTN